MVYRFASTGKTRIAKYEKGTRIEWVQTKHSTTHNIVSKSKTKASATTTKKKFSFAEKTT